MITTIITTYRRPGLLTRAVNSVLSQTFKDFQVCVYDNASGDETEEIMHEFVKRDSRVKYYRHPVNIGMMANYQFALSRINTEYFTLLSDDDILLSDFYETALAGFNQYPDVAFSACGVKAYDEENNFITDPLEAWGKEGYYKNPEGLMEMINQPAKLLLPTGIMFRYQKVKDTVIDCSSDLQLRWDSEYLMNIASKYPIVVNKKTCAHFFAHANGYSTSYYRNLIASSEFIENHLKATDKMFANLMGNPNLSLKDKEIAKTYFLKTIQTECNGMIAEALKQRRLWQAIRFLYKFQSKYPVDNSTWIIFCRSIIESYVPILHPPIRSIYRFFKKMGSFFLGPAKSSN